MLPLFSSQRGGFWEWFGKHSAQPLELGVGSEAPCPAAES